MTDAAREAATPPLVAASPVPPVVPDSEALADHIPASMPQDGLHWYRRWLVAQQQLDAKFQREVSSGSGVVPDKPALADERRCDCYPDPRDHEAWCLKANASVPAVTDDEAAMAENALAARLHQVCRFPAHKGPQVYRDCFVLAREALTALRSAGFLIVHHTKET